MTDTVTTTAAVAAEKAPSKRSQAQVIFTAKLAERAQGLFGSNKEFRTSVVSTIVSTLGVTIASASTMYNSFKKEVEAAGTAKLGRDPKKVKPESTGKKGRPSKKAVEATAETTSTEATVATEAAPAV